MYKLISFLIIIIIAFTVCSSGNKSKTESTGNKEIQITNQAKNPDEGKNIYMKYCFACHQMDGSGVPGMYPSIQKTDWVSGDKNRLIKLVLEGMSGPITVNGEEFDQVMPQHAFLTDQQIADLLTYIRKNFGNKAGPVTADEVSKIRKRSP